MLDEPEPLGSSEGPNASRLLVAAAANCLSASLLFCLTKTLDQIPQRSISAKATGRLIRDEKKRMRIGGIEVQLIIDEELEKAVRLKRCMDLFEDFCVVSASIRQGIPISVEVQNQAGDVLHKNR
jgi:organic hydroperoxide reductase OsmC/OhrA